MVRTSDFQFENVGSIPSNPTKMSLLNFNKLFAFNNKTNKNLKKKMKFSFSFISLTTPFILTNLRLSFNFCKNEKKVLIKQSYILLTWFYYLNFIEKKINTKNQLKFFVMPTTFRKFTLTKAPMAHKNWSKEQYKFQFFKFKISFNVFLKEDNNLTSLNQAVLFIFLTRKNFPQFETNLLFLKNVNIFFYLTDNNFFNYYRFLIK